MDMLVLQMNVCMYEFIHDVKCSEILIFKLFLNGIIFIDSKLSFTSDLSILYKSIRLGYIDLKPDQKEIMWAFELIVGLSTSLFLLN